MKIFLPYFESIDNFHLYFAVALFFVFATWLVITKKARDALSSKSLDKTNAKFFIVYLLASFLFSLTHSKEKSFPIGSLLVGSFIYFSLYHVYLKGIFRLLKKSLSVRILKLIDDKSPYGDFTYDKLVRNFSTDTSFKEEALSLMVKRSLVVKNNEDYQLTDKGEAVSYWTQKVLKTYDVSRE